MKLFTSLSASAIADMMFGGSGERFPKKYESEAPVVKMGEVETRRDWSSLVCPTVSLTNVSYECSCAMFSIMANYR